MINKKKNKDRWTFGEKAGHIYRVSHVHVINEPGISHCALSLKDTSSQYCHWGTKPLKHMGPWMTPKPHLNHNIKGVMRQHIQKAVLKQTRTMAVRVVEASTQIKQGWQGTAKGCKDQQRTADSRERERESLGAGLIQEDFLGRGLMFIECPEPAKLCTQRSRDSSSKILQYLYNGRNVIAIR